MPPHTNKKGNFFTDNMGGLGGLLLGGLLGSFLGPIGILLGALLGGFLGGSMVDKGKGLLNSLQNPSQAHGSGNTPRQDPAHGKGNVMGGATTFLLDKNGHVVREISQKTIDDKTLTQEDFKRSATTVVGKIIEENGTKRFQVGMVAYLNSEGVPEKAAALNVALPIEKDGTVDFSNKDFLTTASNARARAQATDATNDVLKKMHAVQNGKQVFEDAAIVLDKDGKLIAVDDIKKTNDNITTGNLDAAAVVLRGKISADQKNFEITDIAIKTRKGFTVTEDNRLAMFSVTTLKDGDSPANRNIRIDPDGTIDMAAGVIGQVEKLDTLAERYKDTLKTALPDSYIPMQPPEKGSAKGR